MVGEAPNTAPEGQTRRVGDDPDTQAKTAAPTALETTEMN